MQPLYHLRRWSRLFNGTAIAASAVCLLIVLFQLNARIATDPLPLITGGLAPFEWAGRFVCLQIEYGVQSQVLHVGEHAAGSCMLCSWSWGALHLHLSVSVHVLFQAWFPASSLLSRHCRSCWKGPQTIHTCLT